MKITLNFKFWVEVVGDLAVFALLLLPTFITFPKIQQEQNVGNLLCLPFVFTWLNAVAFVFYAVNRADWLVVGINGVAILVESFYCGWYIWYSTGWRRVLAWVMVVVQLAFLAGMLTMQFKTFNDGNNPDTRDRVYGIIGAITACFMYLSTSHQAAFAFCTHDVTGLELAVGFLANASVWTLYSSLRPRDLFLLIANGMGVVFTAFQFAVWLAFRNNQINQPQPPPGGNQPAPAPPAAINQPQAPPAAINQPQDPPAA